MIKGNTLDIQNLSRNYVYNTGKTVNTSNRETIVEIGKNSQSLNKLTIFASVLPTADVTNLQLLGAYIFSEIILEDQDTNQIQSINPLSFISRILSSSQNVYELISSKLSIDLQNGVPVLIRIPLFLFFSESSSESLDYSKFKKKLFLRIRLGSLLPISSVSIGIVENGTDSKILKIPSSVKSTFMDNYVETYDIPNGSSEFNFILTSGSKIRSFSLLSYSSIANNVFIAISLLEIRHNNQLIFSGTQFDIPYLFDDNIPKITENFVVTYPFTRVEYNNKQTFTNLLNLSDSFPVSIRVVFPSAVNNTKLSVNYEYLKSVESENGIFKMIELPDRELIQFNVENNLSGI